MKERLRILVTPRDVGPYQSLLYQDFEKAGILVRYAEGPTPSQTLNIFLAPILLSWWRLRRFRVLHIHWVFQFSLPWARRALWAQRLMEAWFGVYLNTAQVLGYVIVWTAHDLLPHQPVFANDTRARDLLLSKARVVIALSEATAKDLRVLGAHCVKVIPIGPYVNPYPVALTNKEARATFDFDDKDVVVALIGRMERYKGADLLLEAAAKLPKSSRIKILLAGLPSDREYEIELKLLLLETANKAIAIFDWIPDEDVARFLQAADFAAFPFRAISNSGSVLLAMSFGRPVLIPELATLRDIPEDSAIRFEPGVVTLVSALLKAEQLPEVKYFEMSNAALAWATKTDWINIAHETIETYLMAL